MKPTPRLPKFLTLLCAIALPATFCLAQDGSQILDIGISKSGNIEDASSEKRPLEFRKATLSPDKKSATLESINAIIIPYQDNDPLFKNGPQTWLLRIKIPDPISVPSVCLAGRWNAGENRRSIGLLTLANEGTIQFLISTDGSGETTSGLATRDSLPAGEWVTLVAQFQPETRMEIFVYDDSGFLLTKREMTSNVPATFFEDDLPFWIGAPAEMGLEFSRFAVWKRILSETQITSALKNTP